MTRALLPALLLGAFACGTGSAHDARAEIVEAALATRDPSPETAAADVAAFAARTAAWSPAVRAEVADALHELQVSCPYNRASFQLPVALAQGAASIWGKGLDADASARWQAVQAGLVAHAAAVDGIAGPDWASPETGDTLARMPPGSAVSRAALEAAADPVALTRPLLDRIQVTVERYDGFTLARIEAADAVLAPHEAHAWHLKGALLVWRDEMQALAPQLTDPDERARVEAMIAAIEVFVSQRC